MKDISAEVRAITARLPENFWGAIEVTISDGEIKAAKVTETIQINRSPRNTRGTDETTFQRR